MLAFAARECGRICIEATTIHITIQRVPDKCSGARLSLGKCGSVRKETLSLYDARGQRESLGNKRQVGAYLLGTCHNRKDNR